MRICVSNVGTNIKSNMQQWSAFDETRDRWDVAAAAPRFAVEAAGPAPAARQLTPAESSHQVNRQCDQRQQDSANTHNKYHDVPDEAGGILLL